MKKIILAALALATVAASPALAATAHKRVSQPWSAQNSYAGDGCVMAPDRYTVVEENQVIGRDPDAFIRSQIERDHGLQGN